MTADLTSRLEALRLRVLDLDGPIYQREQDFALFRDLFDALRSLEAPPSAIRDIQPLIDWLLESYGCPKEERGICTTLGCLKRGGYTQGSEPPVDYSVSTCQVHELIAVLRRVTSPSAPPRAERAEAGSVTVPKVGFTESGYGDEDECWGPTIDDYVNNRLLSSEPDPFVLGYEFKVDHFLSRSETWRVVSVDPIICELAAPQSAPPSDTTYHVYDENGVCTAEHSSEPESASPEERENSVYWMIERGSPAEWWVGNHRIPNEKGGEWTTDSSKAQHFNEWGAKHHAKELEQWGIPGPLRATEHLDCNG